MYFYGKLTSMNKLFIPLLFFVFITTSFAQDDDQDTDDCQQIQELYSKLPNEKAFVELIDYFYYNQHIKEALYYLEQKIIFFPNANSYSFLSNEEMDDYEYKHEILQELEFDEKCDCDLPKRPTWIDSEGPFGADATSFLKDKKGNYWLGTGSSGGVYYSNNKGKSWTPRNKGIGPWHIYDIAQKNDTIYIQVNSVGDKYRGLYADMVYNIRYYYWDKKQDQWEYVCYYGTYPDEKASLLYLQTEQLFRNEWKKDTTNLLTTPLNHSWSDGSTYSYSSFYYYDSRGVNPHAYTQYTENNNGHSERYKFKDARIFGYQEKNETLSELNKGFPRDVFYVGAGNLHPLKKGKKALLSKNGVYLVDKEKSISPMGAKGLKATDVRQLLTSKNGVIFALVNESDLWIYKNNKWIHGFNAYEHHLQMANPISYKGYDTKLMTLQADNTVLFSFCGELWQMDEAGVATKIEIDLTDVENQIADNYIKKNIISNATKDKDGNFYLTVKILYTERLSMTNNTISEWYNVELLVKVTNGKSKIIENFENIDQQFVFTDQEENVWIKSQNNLHMIGDFSDQSELPTAPYSAAVPRLAFNPKGGFAIEVNGILSEWNSQSQSWSTATENTPMDAINCIGYDIIGDLYLGTGTVYYATCGMEAEDVSNGLYKYNSLEDSWLPILNIPNIWIFSISPELRYGLAVGTSGSGVQFLKTK